MRELQKTIHATTIEKGFWDRPRELPEILCLIHSEISEALEHYRNGKDVGHVWLDEKGKPDGIPIELADVIIRVLDVAEYYGIDMESAVRMKMRFNNTREYRHGKVL